MKIPGGRLHNALLTLHFNTNEAGTTAGERHWTIGGKTAVLSQPVYLQGQLDIKMERCYSGAQDRLMSLQETNSYGKH